MSLTTLHHPAPNPILPKAGTPATAKPCVDTQELVEIILFFQRSLLSNLSREVARGNVSFAQFFLLAALDRGEALTMSEIAARMRHTTAAATGLVDRLETLGYVERAHATDDRRKVLVRITPLGSELVVRSKGDMIRNINSVMTYLTCAEQKAWLQIYRKIHRVFLAQCTKS